MIRLAVYRAVRCRLPLARLRATLRRAARRYPAARGLEEVSLAVIGAAAMRALNRRCRGRDEPTDVLSFGYGEVVVCWPLAVRQAARHRLSASEELVLLFAHGVLHVLGFDHERPGDRSRMAAAERVLLGADGLVARSFAPRS